MKAKLKFGFQWVGLLGFSYILLPVGLVSGLVLAVFGSRPLLLERGTFDSDGTPVRYHVFSLRFPAGREPKWLTGFVRRYSLDWLPSLTSGLRGWLPPAAVGQLWWPRLRSGLERWP